MPLPIMTPEQSAAALAKAAEARAVRSAALAEIKKGTVTAAAVLDDENSPLQKAKVRQVLLAVPGVGPVSADKLLAEIGIDRSRRVKGLGAKQRAALAERLAA